ncbi:Wzz/FepE/Etk N-terminal domain-containing protein [Vibrio chagasii]|nr:Wzz/FepE/Etk N-terminal domain-containing protein [Vibrio chagasii]
MTKSIRELLKHLWDGKLVIILVTALFTVASICFVFAFASSRVV